MNTNPAAAAPHKHTSETSAPLQLREPHNYSYLCYSYHTSFITVAIMEACWPARKLT